jgi:predicted secreted protein
VDTRKGIPTKAHFVGFIIEGRTDIMIMRKITAILLAMATLSCAAPGRSGAGTQPPTIAIDQNAAGSTVELHPGQMLTVTLPGNPTTGFAWEMAPGSGSILASQGEARFTAASNGASAKLGAGGIYRFDFVAVGTGSAPVKFVYRRSFEKDVPPAESFEVTVVVGKP